MKWNVTGSSRTHNYVGIFKIHFNTIPWAKYSEVGSGARSDLNVSTDLQ